MINKVILVGNVGQDPEIRYTGDVNNGSKVATIRLATTERYRDRNNNLQEHTEWHNIVAWDKLAEIAEKFVDKGTQLYIEGKIKTEKYTDKTGVEKFITRIIANTMQLLGKPEPKPTQEPAPRPAAQSLASSDDGDLPFD